MKVKDLICVCVDKVDIYTYATGDTRYFCKDANITDISSEVAEMEIYYISIGPHSTLKIRVLTD